MRRIASEPPARTDRLSIPETERLLLSRQDANDVELLTEPLTDAEVARCICGADRLLPVPDAGSLPAEVARLTEAISKVCHRPVENVHVLYEASARGRQAFGGEIVGASKQWW